MADAIKVAVRVRPFNARESKMGCSLVISMKGNQVFLGDVGGAEEKPRKFAYDYAYWTHNPSDKHFADNNKVYEDLGKQVYDLCFDGYNACLFAYGQTGAGKSYSMWGRPPDDLGIVPKLCTEMFTKAGELNEGEGSAFIEVNYLEVYCERVMDLLNPATKGKQLKVREHPTLGPYVESLSSHAVSSAEQLQKLFDLGQSARTVAATQMNSESSRSHSVFTIKLTVTQPLPDGATQEDKDEATVISKINLVDLAGSERQDKTHAQGQQLKEAANINKSLLALGQVISTLAKGGAKVPYRDSVLTWLLKESLGGNSKTIMIAAISPASDNVEETLSTLRYADMVKKIKNKAVKMEGETARMLREMREEIERLKAAAAGGGGGGGAGMSEEEKARLAESESLMKGMTASLEDRVEEAAAAAAKAAVVLSQTDSFMNRASWRASVSNPDEVPRLIFMSHDDSLNGTLVLPLRKTEGNTIGEWQRFHMRNLSDRLVPSDTKAMLESKAGSSETFKFVQMSPPFVAGAMFEEEGEAVILCLPGGRIYVNGEQLEVGEVRALEHKDRVFAGANNSFLFANSAVTEADTSGEAWTRSRDEVYSKKGKFSAFSEMYEVREAELIEQKKALESAVENSVVSTLQGVKAGKELLASKHARGWSRKVSERNKARVQDAVLELMPGIDEANHLAQVAKRQIMYSIELRSQTATKGTKNLASRKNLFPVVVATDLDYDGDGEADDMDDIVASQQQTWTADKFNDRLLRMRMYCRDLDGDGVVDGLDGDDPFFDTHGKANAAEVKELKDELERLRGLLGDSADAVGEGGVQKLVSDKALIERERKRVEEENAALVAQLESLGAQPVHASVDEEGNVTFEVNGRQVSLHEARSSAMEQAERRTMARQPSTASAALAGVAPSTELQEENAALKKELAEAQAQAQAQACARCGAGAGDTPVGAILSPRTPGSIGARSALQHELAELRDQLKTAHREAHELSHAIAEEARAIASELGKDLGF